jgi:hypothetical protein
MASVSGDVFPWRSSVGSGCRHSSIGQDQTVFISDQPTLRNRIGTASLELRHLPVADFRFCHLICTNPVPWPTTDFIDQDLQEPTPQDLRRAAWFSGSRLLFPARHIRICIFAHTAMVVGRFALLEDPEAKRLSNSLPCDPEHGRAHSGGTLKRRELLRRPDLRTVVRRQFSAPPGSGIAGTAFRLRRRRPPPADPHRPAPRKRRSSAATARIRQPRRNRTARSRTVRRPDADPGR